MKTGPTIISLDWDFFVEEDPSMPETGGCVK